MKNIDNNTTTERTTQTGQRTNTTTTTTERTSGMPATMHSELIEYQVTDSLNECLSALHYAVTDLRAAGVELSTIEQVKATTPEYVTKQLAADKATYFKNMTFVPLPLRRQVDREFADMERTLVPLADKLQAAVKRCPIDFRLKASTGATGDYCVEFDTKTYEDYIKKASTRTIAEPLRAYYDVLCSFVNVWQDLTNAARQLGITQPNGQLLKALFRAQDIVTDNGNVVSMFGSATNMQMSPERFFELMQNGVISMAPGEDI